jgi:hypothetical protein
MEEAPDGVSVWRMEGLEEGISEGDEEKKIVGEVVGNWDRGDGRLVAVFSGPELWMMATGR